MICNLFFTIQSRARSQNPNQQSKRTRRTPKKLQVTVQPVEVISLTFHFNCSTSQKISSVATDMTD